MATNTLPFSKFHLARKPLHARLNSTVSFAGAFVLIFVVSSCLSVYRIFSKPDPNEFRYTGE